jgi:hypothetical protein
VERQLEAKEMPMEISWILKGLLIALPILQLNRS